MYDQSLKIVNIDSWYYSDTAKKIYKSMGQYEEYSGLSKEEAMHRCHDAQVIITRLSYNLDNTFLNNCKKLKYIVSNTTGLDHVDLYEAEKLNIFVISLKGHYEFLRNVYATAEHTWALILASSRFLVSAVNSVNQGGWSRHDFFGHEVHGKSIGIIGYGRIGEKIADYSLAFGLNVYVFDIGNKVVHGSIVRCQSLYEILTAPIDFLTIHVDYREINKNLIDEDALSLLSNKPIVVNTSRGSLVSESAIINALDTGKISGYAADVIAGEEVGYDRISTSEIIRRAKVDRSVLVTPHIGGATFESWEKTEVFCAKECLRVIGSPPKNNRGDKWNFVR